MQKEIETTNNYNYNFFVLDMQNEELKRYIEEIVKGADANKLVMPKKQKKKDIYIAHFKKFLAGEFGEISLRQSCMEAGLPYQCVLQAKANHYKFE